MLTEFYTLFEKQQSKTSEKKCINIKIYFKKEDINPVWRPAPGDPSRQTCRTQGRRREAAGRIYRESEAAALSARISTFTLNFTLHTFNMQI